MCVQVATVELKANTSVSNIICKSQWPAFSVCDAPDGTGAPNNHQEYSYGSLLVLWV